MKSITRGGLARFVGAAALLPPLAAVAQAQSDTTPLTDAQTAGVRRLQEVIEVLNTGDYATIRAYFEANSIHAIASTSAPAGSSDRPARE